MQVAHIAIGRSPLIRCLALAAIVIGCAALCLPKFDSSGDDSLSVLPLPAKWSAPDGSPVPACSRAEARKRVQELTPCIRHWDPLYGLKLFEKRTAAEYVNCAIDLAKDGDPDAEYIVGWMYQNDIREKVPVIQPWDLGILALLDDGSHEIDLAKKWYQRAASHGSPQALTAQANLHLWDDTAGLPGKTAISYLNTAIDKGDVEAKIDLGTAYQNGWTVKCDPQKAMELFESATKSTNEDCVNSALLKLLFLWKEKQAMPSREFCDGASGAYQYVHALAPSLSEETFGRLFEYWGCTPEPYANDRWEMLQKVHARLAAKGLTPKWNP